MAKFPPTRTGLTKRITVSNFDIYITVNCFDGNGPGEVFIKIAKTGSTVSALLEALATTISVALQNGTPWSKLKDKYLGYNFEPFDADGKSILHRIAETIEELSKK